MVEIIKIQDKEGRILASVDPIDINRNNAKKNTDWIIKHIAIDSEAAKYVLDHDGCNQIIEYMEKDMLNIKKYISKCLALGLFVDIKQANRYNRYSMILNLIKMDNKKEEFSINVI